MKPCNRSDMEYWIKRYLNYTQSYLDTRTNEEIQDLYRLITCGSNVGDES